MKNQLGDVYAIANASGNILARYVYDAWGNHKVLNPDGTENTSEGFIGNVNPIRYRGYYFDVETGFYYLQSRYYDPETGRFITMDSVRYIVPSVVNGLNLYAYCLNNPVTYSDPHGNIAPVIGVIVLGVMSIGMLLGLSSDSNTNKPVEPVLPENITSNDLNINDNNPGGSIKITIYESYINIEESHYITDSKDQERIIEIIMESELYKQYGYYRSKESYLGEWRAHNFAYSLWPFGEWGKQTGSVDLNKDLDDDIYGIIYPIFNWGYTT